MVETMTHTFRAKKSEGNTSNNRRYRKNKDNNKSDNNSDLDTMPSIDFNYFDTLDPTEFATLCNQYEIDMKQPKYQAIEQLLEKYHAEAGSLYGKGILEILHDGWGFLRSPHYIPSITDIYVSQSQIKRFGLKPGDLVFGLVRAPKEGEKYRGMLRVESINNISSTESLSKPRKEFDKLTPLFPDEKLKMELNPENIPARLIDLISPIGKGQRGLIVAPPKAGKTTIVKTIAQSIAENCPDVKLMVLLVDERPEEVTDMKRFVRGQVISSTFDEPAENHMRVAEQCMEQAKRMVENGDDVVILLDSLTRLSRASNLTINPSGRTLSGGLDPAALYRPRRFFGAARNIEEGGSLTIIATVMVDTGSRMDDAIFEEFKGTGNMELVLDRDLAERRIWPAINAKKSSTRHDEKLCTEQQLEGVVQLRRLLANHEDSVEAIESLIKLLKRTPNNDAFLDSVVQKTRS